ncbi:MAG: copper amine oxidase N-terminal domain-containing protein [Firmicutes bacterium]|nr:copper amine oxidase N-terminal domain-containing protein [Bacillota bacterium]
MRKICLLSTLVLVLLLLPVKALAVTEVVSLFKIGEDSFYYNGQQYQMDVAPFIKDGRTFIPVRYLANSIGISNSDIRWNPDTATVTLTKGNTVVELVVGDTNLYSYGKRWVIDTAPLVEDGRVFLPARHVVGNFGYTVSWNPGKQTLSINQETSIKNMPEYLDEENNLGISYPSSWEVNKINRGPVVVVFTSPPEDCNDTFPESVTVEHAKDPSFMNMTLDQIEERLLQNLKGSLKSFDLYENKDGYWYNNPAKIIKVRCSDGTTSYCVHMFLTKFDDEYFIACLSAENEDKIEAFYDPTFLNMKMSFHTYRLPHFVLYD